MIIAVKGNNHICWL